MTLPVVMSDIPAHCEFAEGITNVVSIYRTENENSLVEAFDSLLLKSEMLATAREAAFQLVKQNFNFDSEKISLL